MNVPPADDRHDGIRNPGEGQRYVINGMVITIKATAAAPVGPFTLFEIVLPPHLSGPPTHVHRQTTEWFYVLSGALAFTLNNETVVARPGSSILIAPSIVHTFWNPTASVAALIGLCTRADFGEYLTALVGLMAGGLWTNSEQFLALAAQYDQFPYKEKIS